MTWYRDYTVNNGTFSLDMRGSHERHSLAAYVLDNEDLLGSCKLWIKENVATLSVTKVQEHLFTRVLPKIPNETKAKHKIPETIPSRSVTYELMTNDKVGCSYGEHTKCYYVDNHEKEEVRQDRQRYLEQMFDYEFRMYKWIQIPAKNAEALKKKYPDMMPGHFYNDSAGAPMVEYHIDACDDFLSWRCQEDSEFTSIPIAVVCGLCMGGSLSVRFPEGKLPMVHVGQDEACYKAYLLPKEVWSIDAYFPIRPKEEGPSLMLSSFVGAPFFFGIPVQAWVIDKINNERLANTPSYLNADAAKEVHKKRRACKAAAAAYNAEAGDGGTEPGPAGAVGGPATQKPFLPKELLFEHEGKKYYRSPANATLNVGKARDGYWDGSDFLLQTEDTLDVLEVLLPDHEILVEVDHSSGHDKFKQDGLNVNKMSAKFGGKQALFGVKKILFYFLFHFYFYLIVDSGVHPRLDEHHGRVPRRRAVSHARSRRHADVHFWDRRRHAAADPPPHGAARELRGQAEGHRPDPRGARPRHQPNDARRQEGRAQGQDQHEHHPRQVTLSYFSQEGRPRHVVARAPKKPPGLRCGVQPPLPARDGPRPLHHLVAQVPSRTRRRRHRVWVGLVEKTLPSVQHGQREGDARQATRARLRLHLADAPPEDAPHEILAESARVQARLLRRGKGQGRILTQVDRDGPPRPQAEAHPQKPPRDRQRRTHCSDQQGLDPEWDHASTAVNFTNF
jgi:hypothetical protein